MITLDSKGLNTIHLWVAVTLIFNCHTTHTLRCRVITREVPYTQLRTDGLGVVLSFVREWKTGNKTGESAEETYSSRRQTGSCPSPFLTPEKPLSAYPSLATANDHHTGEATNTRRAGQVYHCFCLIRLKWRTKACLTLANKFCSRAYAY